VARDLDVAKVSGLILVEVTLAGETKGVLIGKRIDALNDVALECRTLVS